MFEDHGDRAWIDLDWQRPTGSWQNIPIRYLSPDTNSGYLNTTSVPTVSIQEIGESAGKAVFQINSSHIPTFADGSRGITVYYKSSLDSTERSLTLTNTSQTIELYLSSSSLAVSLQPGAYILGADRAEIFKNVAPTNITLNNTSIAKIAPTAQKLEYCRPPTSIPTPTPTLCSTMQGDGLPFPGTELLSPTVAYSTTKPVPAIPFGYALPTRGDSPTKKTL